MASAATSPGRADSVRLFISYAHEDESLLRLLNQHLAPLRQQGLIKTWHDRAISPGTPWEKQLLLALNEAEVVVLIVTPDFIDSTYIRDVELRQVLERQKDRFVRIVPVIGRFSSWEHVPELSSLQVLPKDGKPVSVDGRARERLLKEAAEGIIQVVREVALDRQVIGNAPERSVPGGPRPDSPRQTNISKQPHSSTDVQKSAQAQSRRRLAIWSSICILIGAACIAALSHISKPDSDNISAVDLLERGKDLYKLKKYVAARPQFVNAGQRGSGEADDYLGLLYRDGLGVSKDYRAAKSGSPGQQRGRTATG
jgi:TIR domain